MDKWLSRQIILFLYKRVISVDQCFDSNKFLLQLDLMNFDNGKGKTMYIYCVINALDKLYLLRWFNKFNKYGIFLRKEFEKKLVESSAFGRFGLYFLTERIRKRTSAPFGS